MDSFFITLQHFISRRGKPFVIQSDRGTNFKPSDKRLEEALQDMGPTFKDQLLEQQIYFKFHPPDAPHFEVTWEGDKVFQDI